MKKFTWLLFSLSIGLWSCSEAPSPDSQAHIPITRSHLDSEVSKTVAQLSVAGMTCSDGCGGKIQKELRELAGVASTKLDFQEGRQMNMVSVEFDPAKISEKELIQCVQGIADGMYSISKVEVLEYHGLQSHGAGNNAGVETSNFGHIIQLLDLVRRVSKLVH